jgi:L-cysteine:1D-myo-inositol 2-amino-2-deoxy-alpha-D-glucopyranoside ligase
MNSWPSLYLPPLLNASFPNLKLKDSNKGLLEIANSKVFNIYVCGITPYDATHLGHAATYLSFDLINRYLTLKGSTVKFVENITDIDDPLLERAKRDKQDWQVLANSQTELFCSDMSSLRVIPPEHFIKVTDSMHLIEKFIKRLSDNGYLYELNGDYYFAVETFLKTLPISIGDAVATFAERGGDPKRVGKKHPLDPVIWLANLGDDPGWQSQLGFGRPGWHVECTAIACEYLDDKTSNPIIDLQGGGSDLIFPHHFMSAALAKALTSDEFADAYLHAAMVGLDGEKMSKSKGNLVFVSKLLNDGTDPMVLRHALLSQKYSQDRMWSVETLNSSSARVAKLRSSLSRIECAPTDQVINAIAHSIASDLDSPTALETLDKWADDSINGESGGSVGELSRFIDSALGLAL